MVSPALNNVANTLRCLELIVHVLQVVRRVEVIIVCKTSIGTAHKAINKENYAEDFYAEATGYSASAFWVGDYDWEN